MNLSNSCIECQKSASRTSKSYANAPRDVWSLGVILVNLTCNDFPWARASQSDSQYCAYLKDRQFLRTILPLSSGLNSILQRVFEPDPLKRISIPELRAQIMACTQFVTNVGGTVVGGCRRCGLKNDAMYTSALYPQLLEAQVTLTQDIDPTTNPLINPIPGNYVAPPMRGIYSSTHGLTRHVTNFPEDEAHRGPPGHFGDDRRSRSPRGGRNNDDDRRGGGEYSSRYDDRDAGERHYRLRERHDDGGGPRAGREDRYGGNGGARGEDLSNPVEACGNPQPPRLGSQVGPLAPEIASHIAVFFGGSMARQRLISILQTRDLNPAVRGILELGIAGYTIHEGYHGTSIVIYVRRAILLLTTCSTDFNDGRGRVWGRALVPPSGGPSEHSSRHDDRDSGRHDRLRERRDDGGGPHAGRED
jgi:hypothetical protein